MTILGGRWSWTDDGVFEWFSRHTATDNSASTTARAPVEITINSRYVDPDTGGWVVDDYKNHKRVNASLGWVYAHLMTLRGSIPEIAWFGSRLREITHNSVGVTSQIENAIDEALRPFVGQKFDSYTRKSWKQNGAPLFSVTITVDGSTGTMQIPLE